MAILTGMSNRISTAAPADWTRSVSGTFTLDGQPVDLDSLTRFGPISTDDAAAIQRLPVGALFELDEPTWGSGALIRRVG